MMEDKLSDERLNRVIADFLEDGGPCISQSMPTEAQLKHWEGKLCNALLYFWAKEGWGSYYRGLITYVNPDDYEDTLEEWLSDTPLEGLDKFHVFARSAFGKLYIAGEKFGDCVIVNPLQNYIFAFSKDFKNPESEIEKDKDMASFFWSEEDEFDLKDDGKGMFESAYQRLGVLSLDEIYGFEPALIAGGSGAPETLEIVKWDQHFSILRQLGSPPIPGWDSDLDL